MKELFTFALTLSLCYSLISQPVITRDDLIMVGDQYAYSEVASPVDPGPAGAGVEWDFSNVVSVDPIGYGVANPAMTPYGANFPGANIATVSSGGGLYQYQNISAGSWEDHGYVAVGTIVATLNYGNTRRYLALPLEYTSQWNDNYTYGIEYSTDPVITTDGEGSVDGRVDAYGVLRLPEGTFPDVLRVRIYGESTDTTDLGFGLYERNYYSDTTYLWWTPSHPAPLCTYTAGSLLRVTTVIQGGDTMTFNETEKFTSFGFDPSAEPEPSSTVHADPGVLGAGVSPNPFAGRTELTFHSTGGEAEILVFSPSGAIVHQERLNAPAGENKVPLQLADMVPGIYLATVSNNNRTDVLRLVLTGDQ